jgi:transposase
MEDAALVHVHPTSLVEIEEQERQTNEELRRLQRQVQSAYMKLEQQRILKKSIKNFTEHSAPEVAPVSAPSDQARRKGHPISPEVKALVVQKIFYENSMSWDEAQRVYNVSKGTISRIINQEKKRKLEESETPSVQHKRGRKSPITVEMLIYMLLELEQDSQLTLLQLVEKVESKFQIQTSTSALDRVLKKCEVTWKNVLPIPLEWNTPEVVKQRTLFIGELGKIFMREIVYVDETGFNLHVKKSKGRALQGEPAKLTLTPKGSRITLIAALSKEGLVHTRMVESRSSEKKKGTNAEDFRNFLIDLFPKLPRGSVIILDNCKIHHAANVESVWQMGRETWRIEHLFLPPYSPFLNPIEYAFNALKDEIARATFRTRGELINVIKEKLSTITPQKAQGFFAQSAQYYSQCALGVPFRGKPLNPEIPDPSASSSSLPALTWNNTNMLN